MPQTWTRPVGPDGRVPTRISPPGAAPCPAAGDALPSRQEGGGGSGADAGARKRAYRRARSYGARVRAGPLPAAPGLAAGSHNWPWGAFMRRAFALDVFACPRCGARLRVLATVDDPVGGAPGPGCPGPQLARLIRTDLPPRADLPSPLGSIRPGVRPQSPRRRRDRRRGPGRNRRAASRSVVSTRIPSRALARRDQRSRGRASQHTIRGEVPRVISILRDDGGGVAALRDGLGGLAS
jgi:hypothetical protein